MTCGLVRIRLSRFGRVNNPVYNIVVTRSHKARDAKPIEVLGTYDPKPQIGAGVNPKKADVLSRIKDVRLDFERAKYWIGVGAQPSNTVTKLLRKAGILDENWGKHYDVDRKVVVPRREVVE